MGLVYTAIELINAADLGLVRRGFLTTAEVRRSVVSALVDSGASMLVIPEVVRRL